MAISRWKVMAGVLGVSLGGLAAIAGQCPRSDDTRAQRADDAPLVVEAPRVPPAGAGTKPTPPPAIELPTAPGSVTLPLPALPIAVSEPVKLPAFSLPETANFEKPITSKKPDAAPAVLPAVPPPATPTVIPASGTTFVPFVPKVQEPTLPSSPPLVPETKPATPPSAPAVTVAPPAPTNALPLPMTGNIEFTKSGSTPPATVPDLTPMVNTPTPPTGPPAPTVTPSAPTATPPAPTATPPAPTVNSPADVRLTAPINAAPPVTSSATKFRILLRVGEGEPSFEVRTGDDLVMKVLCEKVDIKSPEKGQSLSSVTASGKVRFAGFGSEGTCESLSFLAGTGEVSMTGSVKIQVKDKLGRVESELTTDTIKYKLDASALPGQLRP